MRKTTIMVIATIISLLVLLTSCSTGIGKKKDPFEDKATEPFTGYKTMADYDGEEFWVDVTVKEIQELMEKGETFAFIASFESCPYCNRALPYVAEAVKEYGGKIGYLNTRKDPSWSNNLDIDDYDIFAELFGDYLQLDAVNIPHLYVPDMFFIKNGKIVANCDCSVTDGNNATLPLTDEQEKELRDNLKECFDKL